MDHIRKWREKIWVIGYYEVKGGKPRLISTLCLTPDEMEPWIAQLEAYVKPDFELGQRVARKLTMDDVIEICGKKESYTLVDAQRLHKKQWTVAEYRAAMDQGAGYSPERMLHILQQRAEYLMSRGATLNNPHIPKSFLKQFDDQLIMKEHAARIRQKFTAYYRKK